MTGEQVRVGAHELTRFGERVFMAAGMSAEHAATVAEILVWANLRGVDSHGVLRMARYLNMMDNGRLNPRPNMRLLRETPATLVIDADRAPGPVALTHAMKAAIPKARQAGICWGLVRGHSHAAAIGYYTLMAAREGMAGLSFVASTPNMAYHGARAAGVSTSAIAIAVPGAAHAPLMLDMAAAVASVGKLMHARHAGQKLPEGWALDREGNPTTDAERAALPLPLGGPKGAGLALMVECLASILVGNPIIAAALGNTEGGDIHRQNSAVIAVDIAAFTDPKQFLEDVDDVTAALKTLPRAPGVDEILAPGERGDRILAERSQSGIPLAAGTWKALSGIAARFGLDPPETL